MKNGNDADTELKERAQYKTDNLVRWFCVRERVLVWVRVKTTNDLMCSTTFNFNPIEMIECSF